MSRLFHRQVAAALADAQLRSTLHRSTRRLHQWRAEAYQETTDFSQLQAAAGNARQQALAKLPELLEQLETQARANGVHVFWAKDASAATAHVVDLARQMERHGRPPRIVKARSATCDEIGLDGALTAASLPYTDTQIGDYILQLSDDAPSHRVFPALHRRKEDVGALFQQKLDMPETLNIQAMAGMARFKLRRTILHADLAITGVSFAVAETGTLAVVSDTGNDRLMNAVASVHVLLMGIDKVVPTLDDLVFLAQMLTRSAEGAAAPSYLNLYHGPSSTPTDPDGPREMHLIVLDNGRSELLRQGFGQSLACIHCGACLNACPIYREVGGHVYGSHYGGPIGAILMPLLPTPAPQMGFFSDLPYASTLCGACAEVCPVGIDIPGLLLKLRNEPDASNHARRTPISGRKRIPGRHLFRWVMNSPRRYRLGGRLLRAAARVWGRERIRRLPPPFRDWASGRDLPVPAARPFRDRWTEARTTRSPQGVMPND